MIVSAINFCSANGVPVAMIETGEFMRLKTPLLKQGENLHNHWSVGVIFITNLYSCSVTRMCCPEINILLTGAVIDVSI